MTRAKWTRETSMHQTAEVHGCKIAVQRWWGRRAKQWRCMAFLVPPGDTAPWSRDYRSVPEAKAAAVRLAELLGGKGNG